MIYEALSGIAGEMNQYFRLKLSSGQDTVIVSSLAALDGSVSVQGENKLVLTLLNIEKEPVQSPSSPNRAGSVSPQRYNLIVLLSAYFTASNYAEGLRYLVYGMSFLQEHNVLTPGAYTLLDERLEKIIIEPESLTLAQLNSIWATLGAKHLPSMAYKVRSISLDSSRIREYRPLIAEI